MDKKLNEKIDEMLKYYDEGKTIDEIAELTNQKNYLIANIITVQRDVFFR